MPRKKNIGWVTASAAICLFALLLVTPLRAQSNEGYDPMLQITHQIARPNIYIVLDVSGSMAWDVNGSYVGVDATGTIPSGSWSSSTSNCKNGRCKDYYYTLQVSQSWPSRMAMVKNSLGNSVTIVSRWVEPTEWTTDTTYGYITSSAWHAGTISGPTVSHSGTSHTYEWHVHFSNKRHSPGAPFTAFDSSGILTVGTGGVSLPPADLIGKTSDVVNWGLIVFSSHYGNCSSQTLRVAVNPYDTGDVSAIEGWLRLASHGGQTATGGTPTRGALYYARSRLQATFNIDPKYACPRTYGVILVTDGESNSCNPSNRAWSSCHNNYTSYPAGRSEQLWNLALSKHGSTPKMVRTWVIGVSDMVGKCELNYTAYMGRTDADSPNGDAGFDTAGDPYLPTATGDESRYAINSSHTNYAYFTKGTGGLKAAFEAIVASVGAGDYTSAAPVSTPTTGSQVVSLVASAEFPGWKGHLYAYDISQDPPTLLWDAGEVLSTPGATGYVAPSSRKIYTWDASNNLVEVTAANLATLQSAAVAFSPSFDPTTLTAPVVDFIRGNDGAGTGRIWRLGPNINSTPAITQAPIEFTLGNLPSHAAFENTYADRTALAWVGSGDGMLHAFRLENGGEVLAILPPNLLAQQVKLFNNYQADPTKRPLGQPELPSSQVYGVAGSPRYADIYFGGSTKAYRTVMILTEAAGGDLMAGIDVTSVVPGDANYAVPKVLWTKTGSSLSGLYETWSTPAMAAIFASGHSATWSSVSGAGFNESSTSSSQVVPKVFTFNPGDGSAIRTLTLGSDTSSSYVGNQSFADSVLYDKTADAYYPDNVANLGLQADLKGILWFLSSPSATPTVGVNATAKAGQTQPLYYPPAVTGYTYGSTKYDLYAFGSGTFYERSPEITGQYVGTSGHFVPSLYLVAKGQDTSQATSGQILRIPIKDLFVPNVDGTPSSTHLGARSQMTASPALFTPIAGATGSPVALFLVFDPDSGLCGGTSYIAKITFDIVSGAPHAKETTVYKAGEGAASGFSVAGTTVVVARSHIGAGGRASVSHVPNLNPTSGMTNPTPLWWRELK